LSRDEYVDLLAGLLSGESDRVSEANKTLYEAVVDKEPGGGTGGLHPSLALVDAEQRLQG
jgi:hypothetical protein